MGQITTATIAMIRRAVDANQAPPLTLWEFRELAFLAEKQIATQQAEAPTASNEREAFEAWLVENRFDASSVDGQYVMTFTRYAWLAWQARAALATQQEAQPQAEPAGGDKEDALREFFALHAAEVDANPYAYCEVAYTRATGWMAWITDKPLACVVENPDRKVLMRGQGDTPEEAAADAIRAARAIQQATGERG